MNKTGIEWTDYTWNPVTGCKHDCRFCYARAMYRRFGESFEPRFRPERLDGPSSIKKPSKIFVCSVADLFGEWVPDDWIRSVLSVATANLQHTFQFLTKNPARLPNLNPWPGNCWVGATTTDQDQWDAAVKYLPKVDASVRFISAEPLLADIEPSDWCPEWLIIGPCTGRYASQPSPQWVKRLELFADAHNCAVFHKPSLTSVPPARREYPTVQDSTLFRMNAK